jgi:hypothetical protein
MLLPGVGAKGADTILEMREAKGDLELEDLSHVPYLRLTPQLIKCNRAYMLDPFHRCSIPTQNRHDAFSELMATSIVPELIYLYIPLGSVSL